MKFFVLTAALMLTTAGSALAEKGLVTLGGVEGKVLVNAGEGFTAASKVKNVRLGDKIMLGTDSFATLTYGKCSAVLSAPGVVTVTPELACGTEQQVNIMPTADFDGPSAGPLLGGIPLLPLLFLAPVVGFVGYQIFDEVLGDDAVVPPPAS